MSEQITQNAPPVKVLLLGLDMGQFDAERSMDELAALCEANNMEAVASLLQKKGAPEAGTVLGEGKLAEARLACENLGAEAAVFDLYQRFRYDERREVDDPTVTSLKSTAFPELK